MGKINKNTFIPRNSIVKGKMTILNEKMLKPKWREKIGTTKGKIIKLLSVMIPENKGEKYFWSIEAKILLKIEGKISHFSEKDGISLPHIDISERTIKGCAPVGT